MLPLIKLMLIILPLLLHIIPSHLLTYTLPTGDSTPHGGVTGVAGLALITLPLLSVLLLLIHFHKEYALRILVLATKSHSAVFSSIHT